MLKSLINNDNKDKYANNFNKHGIKVDIIYTGTCINKCYDFKINFHDVKIQFKF